MQRLVTNLFNFSSFQQRLVLIGLGVLFFFPFLGNVHLFDWDEINFAEITREMIITGEYFKSQINFQTFYEKPPLFNWLQLIPFKLFGINEFSARFPNAVFGILTLLLLYEIAKKVRGKEFAMLYALLYLGTLLPHFYFKTGVIDPVFNFFIFLSLYLLIKGINQNKTRFFVLAGFINGLAILTKGPIGFLLIFLTLLVYFTIYKRSIYFFISKRFLYFLATAIATTFIWLLPQILTEGSAFITAFITYMLSLATQDVATHGQPFYYHFVVLFFGCFPASMFALKIIFKKQKPSKYEMSRWMLILFWVVLLLFSIVKTKIVHYSSMAYMPLVFLATETLLKSKKRALISKYYYALGLFFSFLFIVLPIFFIQKKFFISLIDNDPFSKEIIKSLKLSPWLAFIGFFLFMVIKNVFALLNRGETRRAIVMHTLGFGLFIQLILVFYLPPIERATQGPAIEYYKRFANKDVLLTTYGFHSYGKIYYFEKPPNQTLHTDVDLLTKPFDKPVYFVVKVGDSEALSTNKSIRFLEQKGAYKLYVKE